MAAAHIHTHRGWGGVGVVLTGYLLINRREFFSSFSSGNGVSGAIFSGDVIFWSFNSQFVLSE